MPLVLRPSARASCMASPVEVFSSASAPPAMARATTRIGMDRFMAFLSSVELLQLFAHRLRRERQVLAVAHHGRLSFAAHNESQEFADLRIQRRVRIGVDL